MFSPRLVKRNLSEDWIVFKSQHEAIIDRQTFENVQKCFHRYVIKKNSKCFYNEFKKKVYCKGCCQLLERHYKSNDYFRKKEIKSFFYKCDYGTAGECCNEKVYI